MERACSKALKLTQSSTICCSLCSKSDQLSTDYGKHKNRSSWNKKKLWIKFKEFLKNLEGFLEGNEYFVGGALTLADIRVAAGLVYVLEFLWVQDSWRPFPNLHKHFLIMTLQDQFRSVFGACKVEKRPIRSPSSKKKRRRLRRKRKRKKEEKKVDPIEFLPPNNNGFEWIQVLVH